MNKTTYTVDEEVIVNRTLHRDKIGKVTHITPTGIVVVEVSGYLNTIRFNNEGRERGATGYYRNYLFKATPERVEKIRKFELAEKIHRFLEKEENVYSLDLETYKKMALAIDSTTK